jgi:ADP-ribosylglycohydrolase
MRMSEPSDVQAVADRVRGTLVGLAAGDRNGGPIRMAVRLAESLADRKGFDAGDVFERYKDWMRTGAFDTGPVTGGVLRLAVEEGRSARDAASRVHRDLGGYTAGCNAAHRIAPLAMCAEVADGDLDGRAKEEAALTHRHPLAGDASAAVAVLCRALIRGEPLQVARDRAARGRREEIAAAVADDSDVRTLSGGGYSPETLRAAMHFVGRYDGFDEALSESLTLRRSRELLPGAGRRDRRRPLGSGVHSGQPFVTL